MKSIAMLVCFSLAVATFAADAVKVLKAKPATVSKVLHIECGEAQADVMEDWSKDLDKATLAKDYSYDVAGKVWNGEGYCGCWYDETQLSFTLKLPKGVAGTLYLYCVDHGADGRVQGIALNGKELIELKDFGPWPDGGKWLEIPITAAYTKEGALKFTLENRGPKNAIVSIVDFQPEEPKK